MAQSTQHYTMISLGSITASFPNGEEVHHPLSYSFEGTADSLRKDFTRQASIDDLVQENVLHQEEELRKQGAHEVRTVLRLIGQVL